jgi:hypothetical protein
MKINVSLELDGELLYSKVAVFINNKLFTVKARPAVAGHGNKINKFIFQQIS